MKTQSIGLWDFLDQQRGANQFSPNLILQAKREGVAVTLEDALTAVRRMSARSGEVVAPQYVTHLIAELLKAHSAKSVLDPWSFMPWEALQIHAACPTITKYDVVSINPDSANWIGTYGGPGMNGTIAKGWTATKPNMEEEFDAIVSLGPLGMREAKVVRGVDVVDDSGLVEMCAAAGNLSNEGLIVWLTTTRFAFDQQQRSVKVNLEKLGLYLNGWIQLPAGAFLSTSIPFALVLIQKKDAGNIFVIEAPPSEESILPIVQSWMKRKHRGRLANGVLIDRDQFRGAGAIQTEEAISATAGWKVGEQTPFNTAVHKVVRSKKGSSEFEPLPEDPHAVYLPMMGRTVATTAQDKLPATLKSYLQLIVNPEVAHPEYLARWFNTEAGLLFRSMASSGLTIPAITSSRLSELSIPLPATAQQQRMVDTQRTIDQLRIELKEAESAVWGGKGSLDEITRKLPSTDHEARFAEWIETLPFPLASILRHYHFVDRSFKDKRDRLLHFFEAFAEFMAIIHLSAYTSDSSRWLLVQDKLKRAANGADLDFRRASFGLWCTVYNALAKETRAMLNGKDDDKQAIADLYSVASQTCLDGLVDKGLSQILEAANNMRNRKAHGGVLSEAEAQEQHKELAALLQSIRDRLGSSFYSLQLVQAGSADGLPNGGSRVSVRVLTGSNPQFKAQDIELLQHVIKGQLYLHETGRPKVLGIAPLVQMKEKEQPACYFYNRLEGGIPQLVSYHFEHRAEEVDDTGSASAFLDRLAQ